MIDTEDIDQFPVILYNEERFELNDRYKGKDLKDLLCSVFAIPGISGPMRFSEGFSGNHTGGAYQRSISFSLKFEGMSGRIGMEFLHSALERTRYWHIASDISIDYTDDTIATELQCDEIHPASIMDFLRCVNTEINTNPRWGEYANLFCVISTSAFKRVK